MLIEFLANMLRDAIIELAPRFFFRVGSLVFSAFTLFKKSPQEFYTTKNFDKKVGMGWTGFFFSIFVIVLIVLLYKKLTAV